MTLTYAAWEEFPFPPTRTHSAMFVFCITFISIFIIIINGL